VAKSVSIAFHCGIHLDYGYFHCWVCDSSGSFPDLIKILCNVDIKEAKRIAYKYGYSTYSKKREKRETNGKEYVKFPPDTFCVLKDSDLAKLARNYLRKRNVPEKLWNDIYFSTWGQWFGRIIFPIREGGIVKSLVGRAFLKNVEPRYLNLRNEDSVEPLKKLVYNIDGIKLGDKVLIVEGIFDCLRFYPYPTVALFGKEITETQVLKILSKRPSKLYLMFDGGEKYSSNKVASFLNSFVETEIMELPEKIDPSELSPLDKNKIVSYIWNLEKAR